jgi:hypothetical protein
MEYEPALILTLRLDEVSQAFFEDLRQSHFPADRNYLRAHFTLFHKLPVDTETIAAISNLHIFRFNLLVTGLMNLGNGVAFRIEAEELDQLHKQLKDLFAGHLSNQDKQGYRGHVTIQNKVSALEARALLAELSINFQPFTVSAIGLDLWEYLGGPWSHQQFIPFY